MAFQVQELHFALFPLMAPGHTIPMIDIARLLARSGVTVTLITTPVNANRFKTIVARAKEAGLKIQVAEIRFPSVEVGLPEGCENFDMLSSMEYAANFFLAAGMLKEPVEQLLAELKPAPSCIIADLCFPWTTNLAQKFGIPRLVFHGMCCFSLLSMHNLKTSNIFDSIASESEQFLIPGLPDEIEVTKIQILDMVCPKLPAFRDFQDQLIEAEKAAYGIVVNTFEELEPEYFKRYAEAKGKKVWCVGPVSLCNRNNLDKAERGNKSSIDEHECLKWLDSKEPSSVVYVCLGSLSRLATSQMLELGLGLEDSGRPFVWCIRVKSEELEKWISEQGFEERTTGRGLMIRGWAPQVLILSHPAVGGFLTHCGWNSTVEGVCAGVPMITWPMFAEQFYNEKSIVHVLKIGVRVGVDVPVNVGEEEKVGVLVTKKDIKMAVDKLMDGGNEGEERRKRARKLGKMAERTMLEGGSSHLNMKLLIQDVMEQANNRKSTT